MKYICPQCGRVSKDGNQWCQEIFCPAENSLEILDDGEWFSDIEVIKPLTVLRSSVIYVAQRAKSMVLLKVAHDGMQERLKREAALLLEISKHGQVLGFPTLLSAYEQAPVGDFPYGRVVLRGKEKYYEVMAYEDGALLRNILLKNPQPWFQQVGWITMSIADALLIMHQNKRVNLCLNPDSILVRFDKQNFPRVKLLDLGVAAELSQVAKFWDPHFNFPSYTAPELVRMKGELGAASEVYNIGLILYEMLAGRPAFEFKLRKDADIYRAVLQNDAEPTGRSDLKNIPQIAQKAVSRKYANRQPDVLTFTRELQPLFLPLPVEKRGFKINWRYIGIVLGVALAISLLLALALTFPGQQVSLTTTPVP